MGVVTGLDVLVGETTMGSRELEGSEMGHPRTGELGCGEERASVGAT